jgi:hypothetical protein
LSDKKYKQELKRKVKIIEMLKDVLRQEIEDTNRLKMEKVRLTVELENSNKLLYRHLKEKLC